MSNKYKHGDYVPTDVLADRLHDLGLVVTEGPDAVRREFTMRVPAEMDRDADIVLTESAVRMKELQAQLAEAREALTRIAAVKPQTNASLNVNLIWMMVREAEKALAGRGVGG